MTARDMRVPESRWQWWEDLLLLTTPSAEERDYWIYFMANDMATAIQVIQIQNRCTIRGIDEISLNP